MDSGINTTKVLNVSSLHCSPNTDLGAVFLRIVMIIEITVGLPVNILTLWIFCFRMKFSAPHTLYLFNLVLADFLLLISLPFRIDSELRGTYWVFGQVWCRINLFMLAVNRSASIAFMTVVALDRYFKVVHPHHTFNRMTLTQSGWLIGLTWIVVIALRIPLLTTNLLDQSGNLSLCRSFNAYNEVPLAIKFHYATFTAEFFLPWLVLLFCSARIACYLHKRQLNKQKKVRRAIQAVVVISLVFTICFMPSVITGWIASYIKNYHPDDCKSYNLMTKLFKMCLGFTYLNSALDPIIYAFSSSAFHDVLRSFISHLGFVKKNVRAANHR